MGRSLAPELAPLKVGAVVERYLRLHLQADLHRPQSVRHMRDALPAGDLDVQAHPEMSSLAELHREYPARRGRRPHPDDHGGARPQDAEHVDQLLHAV
jgi:hypothetical protein